MGLDLSFVEGEGPRFAVRTADDESILKLRVPDLAKLRYVFDAIAQVKAALASRVPLLGFAGSPFTLACYMIEGGSSDDFGSVRRMAYARPDLLERLVRVNADAVTAYLIEQIRAGVDAVMLFDTWGGLLPVAQYRQFSLAPTRTILERLPKDVPTIVFTRNSANVLRSIVGCGASCVGLDWTSDLAAARRQFGAQVAFQGNLDPLALLTDPATIGRLVRDIVEAAGPEPGYVFNLGHGVVPATPPEHVALVVDEVHRLTRH